MKNLVELLGILKITHWSKITVEYFEKSLLCTSQGSAATICKWGGQVYKFLVQVYSGCDISKIMKNWLIFHWVIPKIKRVQSSWNTAYIFQISWWLAGSVNSPLTNWVNMPTVLVTGRGPTVIQNSPFLP